MKFQGEMMECIMCDRRQKSDPTIESGWTCIELDEVSYYVCPKHLGNPTWSAAKHKRQYGKILLRINELERKRNNH